MDDGAVDDARDRARDRCAWVWITSSLERGGVVPDRDWWNGPRLTFFLSVFSCLAAWSKEDVL